MPATTTTTSSPPSILRQSTSIILSSLPSLLLLSLLLLSLRSSLLAGHLLLSSLPDSNPLLRSLLSRLSSPPPPSPTFSPLSPSLPFPPFFPSPSLSHHSSLPNSSLSLNSPSLTNPRVRVSVPTIIFSLPNPPSHQKPFSFLTDGLHLLHLLSLLSSAHTAAILAFTLCHAAALGLVFHSAAAHALARPAPPPVPAIRLGVRRLAAFVFLKWALRDAIAQLLFMLFFADVDDQNTLFRLFVRVKLMPFSLGEEVLGGFAVAWGVLDFAVSVGLVFVPWIVVGEEGGRRGREVVREGVGLVSGRCVWIKGVEVVLGGRAGRRVFAAVGGRTFAMWAQAAVEVYFMVVWLVVYLEARRREFELGGRRFGREELERCVDRL